MKSVLIAGFLFVVLVGQAHAQVYYSFPQWDRLSEAEQAIYIAGAYDSLVSIASPNTASAARHYSRCLATNRLSSEQLARNVRTFVANRPDLQKGPVQGGLVNYLVELCGAPPN